MQVIATAGRVDHGKSALVRVLTGMEPDRWAEERRRGLTIDLGFAWTKLPGGERVAFVDVPGHERFVPNMLAGVGPVPAVLFVVAAGGGWMPQSAEHLAAINAVGIRRGRQPARHPGGPRGPGHGTGRGRPLDPDQAPRRAAVTPRSGHDPAARDDPARRLGPHPGPDPVLGIVTDRPPDAARSAPAARRRPAAAAVHHRRSQAGARDHPAGRDPAAGIPGPGRDHPAPAGRPPSPAVKPSLVHPRAVRVSSRKPTADRKAR